MSTLIAQTSLQEQTIASASSLVKTKQMNPVAVLTDKTTLLFLDALTDDALEPQISAATEQANAGLVMTPTGDANVLNISPLNEENPTVGTSAEELSTSSGQTGTESISSVGTSVGAGSIPFATMMVVGALGLSQTAFDDSTTDITGTANNDVLDGDSGNNKLSGFEGDDQLNGGGGNDTLDGGTGNNTLNGGQGSDTAIYQIDLNNQSGKNLVDLNSTQASVNVYLSEGLAYDNNDAYFNDVLISIENVITGNGNDYVIGSGENNLISSGGGADYLIGNGGNDTILGGDEGDGNKGDWIVGGAGNDYIDGGTGSDSVGFSENAGNVTLNLSTGIANSQGEGVDTLVGVECVFTSVGNDAITGSNAAEVLNANDGNNTIYGMGGDDSLYAYTFDTSTQYIDGGEDNDYIDIYGNASNNSTLYGGAGNDTINTHTGGTSIIYGDAGNDSVMLNGWSGSSGSNTVYGGAGDDSIESLNNNVLYADGGVDNDTIIGTASGADSLLGGAGDDVLIGGGSGNDATDTIDGGADNDTWLSVSNNYIDSSVLDNMSGIEKIDLTNEGTDYITLSVNDVLDMSDTSNTLIITGDTGDVVVIDTASWTQGTTQTGFDGNTYDVYTNGTATLLINGDLTVSSMLILTPSILV